MDGFPFTPEQLTLSGLLGFTIMSILLGWIVPGRFYKEAINRVREERQAKEKAVEANEILTKSLYEVLRRDDVAHAAVSAIREEANKT